MKPGPGIGGELVSSTASEDPHEPHRCCRHVGCCPYSEAARPGPRFTVYDIETRNAIADQDSVVVVYETAQPIDPTQDTLLPLMADRLTAVIESRMSRDLAWLDDDGKTVLRLNPEEAGWHIAWLYKTGDVVSGLRALPVAEAAQPIDVDLVRQTIHNLRAEWTGETDPTEAFVAEYARLSGEEE